MRATTLAIAGGLMVLAGCSGGSEGGSTGDRLTIVADVHPVAFAAKAVGGDAVDVITLAAPGVEPHDLELTAAQVKQVAGADLVAYVPGMAPALEDAIAQQAPDRAVDVTAGIDLLDAGSGSAHAYDPHVWMDPTNMSTMGAAIATALAERYPSRTWSAAGLQSSMTALDAEFRTALAPCRIKPLVVSHEAFGYLARAYGFEQHGISGLSPDAEPSPAKMREIADLVESQGVTTIYYEALVSPKAAEAIAAETGATTALLDPIEGATGGKDYQALMREDLATLQKGQGCL